MNPEIENHVNGLLQIREKAIQEMTELAAKFESAYETWRDVEMVLERPRYGVTKTKHDWFESFTRTSDVAEIEGQ